MGNCLDQPVAPATDEYIGDENRDLAVKAKEGKAGASTRVKIVITEKQWEDLMSHADKKGFDVHEMLLSYMNAMKSQTLQGNVGRGQQMWKPSLQSIPEVSE